MPNDNPVQKEPTKDELLTWKLAQILHQSGTYTSGNLAALLGNMAVGNCSLSKVAHDALALFYIPTRKVQQGNNPANKVDALEVNRLRVNMNKIGAYRYATLIEPTYQKRKDTKDVYSDQYFGKLIAQDPKISAISLGLENAQFSVQMQEEKEIIGDKSELVGRYIRQGEYAEYNSPFNDLEPKKIYENMTEEELEAWKKEWKDYYVKQHHEEFVAESLWESPAISREERNYWGACFGMVDDRNQWVKYWVSLKPYREEYEAEHTSWLTRELTAEEWDHIKAKYHVPVYDLNHANVNIDLDAPEQDLANADWEEKKETYRRQYWDDVLAPKWAKEWEELHGMPWHPEPVLTEKEKSAEEENFNDLWYNDDDAPKYFWLDYMRKSVLRMNDFFGYGSPLEAGRNEEYLKEQDFLKNLEAERVKKQNEGLTKQQIKAQKDAAALEDQKALYEQMYRLFTEGDFSALTTEQYLTMKKAVREAAANYINTKDTPKRAKWYPEHEANDVVCKLMPLFDSTYDRMDNLELEEEYNTDFLKLQQTVKRIAKQLKRGSSDEDLAYLMEGLFTCDAECRQYMQEHPRPTIFRWNAYRRYRTVKNLHKGIVKGLIAIKGVREAEGLKNRQAEYNEKAQLDHDRAAVQSAKQQLKPQNSQAYENAQKHIREGLDMVKQMQAEGRRSIPADTKVQHEAELQNGRKSVKAPTAAQMNNGKH